jgi:helicase
MKERINEEYSDATIDLALDTIKKEKQGLIFVNTRRSAESTAEKISLKIKSTNTELMNLSDDILHVLQSPTKQCKRLAMCVKKGIAFHHSGLTHKQRELIEDNFRSGKIKIICCTPTLAYGLDLPAYRTIIRDLYRYGGTRGTVNIPVLEYLQISGRAGRPRYDSFGESVAIAKSVSSKDNIIEKYIKGKPEEITSKLAVEPALRTYVLSLIATEFVRNKNELLGFFERTFYAYQYKDMEGIEIILTKIIKMLEEWEFLKSTKEDFVSADKIADEKLEATLLGKRVSELYIDPLTAFQILTCLRKASSKIINEFSFLHMISSTLELRPLLRTKVSEFDEIQQVLAENQSYLLVNEPNIYEQDYDEFINTIKTAMVFQEWMDEKDEEFLLEKYNVRPGELRAKITIADWMLYASEELARLLQFQKLIKEIRKTRFRLKYGIKEELMPLVKLKNIGRVRARKLFRNKIKDIGDIKKSDFVKLAQLLGKNTAVDVKKQVGQDFSKMKVKEKKRKGQKNINDF